MDNEEELEFLRYAYSTLNTQYRIFLQKFYSKPLPDNYYIFVCESCKEDVAVDMCHNKKCGKIICDKCRNNVCVEKKGSYCPEHLNKCPSCKTYCACHKCRVYVVNKICNICSETYETSFSCRICSDKSVSEQNCVYCKESMNPYTLERI